MTTIAPEQVPDLMTVDETMEALSYTTFTDSVQFTADGSTLATVSLPENWNYGLKDRPGTDMTDAAIEIGSKSYFMSKDALLDMTSQMGIQRDYVAKTPPELMEPHINHWLGNLGKDFRLLLKGDDALALCRAAAVVPFSNEQILEQVVTTVAAKGLGSREDLRVDYKFHHDLKRTAMRVIVPGQERVIASERDGGSDDVWHTGVQILNSLTGHFVTSIEGYLFAWWCTNGAITKHSESAKYNRRVSGQDEGEMLEWADTSVANIFDDLTSTLDHVSELTNVNLDGEFSQTMIDVLHSAGVPVGLRESIMANAIDMDDTSAYGLMNAITQSANGLDVKDHMRQRVMTIGGDMLHAFSERCNSCHRLPVL